MATHYQAIGFTAATLDELEEQVNRALEAARHIPARPGSDFAVWEVENGPALWVQVRDGNVVGAHPFYAAASRFPARVEAVVPDPESPMDGQARLYLLPDESVLLPVDVLNWPLVADRLKPQSMVTAQLAAFAETLETWDTPESYAATHADAKRQGIRWIVPTGLFPEEKGGTGRATVLLTGVVRSAAMRENPVTGGTFRSLRIETKGFTVDGVAADGPLPSAGGVVRGHFWLAALVEPSAPDSLLRLDVG